KARSCSKIYISAAPRKITASSAGIRKKAAPWRSMKPRSRAGIACSRKSRANSSAARPTHRLKIQRSHTMSRLPEIDAAKLTAEQRAIYDRMMRERGHMRGPFAVWLRNAELCESTLRLQEMFAARVKLERRLLELMILVSARLATAHYAWFIHEPHALKFGIAPEIVAAIRGRRTLSAGSYQRGLALLGEQAMVELVAAIGFYSMVAMTLYAFAVAVPA